MRFTVAQLAAVRTLPKRFALPALVARTNVPAIRWLDAEDEDDWPFDEPESGAMVYDRDELARWMSKHLMESI